MLTDKHIRLAAYFIGEEIQRRQRFGYPIPQSLRELPDALNRALFADEQPSVPVLPRLKTTKELAAEWKCSPMTVRRKAEAAGGRKIDGRWIFEGDT